MTNGTSISIDAAISTGHRAYRIRPAIGPGYASVARLFRWISSGHRKSFHTLTQVSTPSTSTAT